jgi:hypothetical protein
MVLERTQLHPARPGQRPHAKTAITLVGNELDRRTQDLSFSIYLHAQYGTSTAESGITLQK